MAILQAYSLSYFSIPTSPSDTKWSLKLSSKGKEQQIYSPQESSE
jgi:hypothetical protein